MINTVSDKSLIKHTGKPWKEWIVLLNKVNAQSWTHQQIVLFLQKECKQSEWWKQILANGYEVSVGKRIEGQTLKGTYTLTATKSFNCSAAKLWSFLNSEEGIRIWLNPMSDFKIAKDENFEISGGIYGEVRTLKKGERVRLYWFNEDWPKKTVVQAQVLKRNKQKCLLVFSHEEFPTARSKAQMKDHWKQVIDCIATQVKSNPLTK